MLYNDCFLIGTSMPKAVDVDTKRAQFVAASLDVIANEGLAAATMRRIAAQAGATTGAVTHYFAGREAVLLEAVRAAHFAAGARMQDAARHCPSAADRLEAVVLQALPLDAVRLREWRVWTAFRSVLPGNSALWAANEAGYGAWRGYLQMLLAPFCVDADSVRREVSLLMALVDGIGFRLASMTVNAEDLAAEQMSAAADVLTYLRRVVQGAYALSPEVIMTTPGARR
jgi:AcrR family transcriptional regulator